MPSLADSRRRRRLSTCPLTGFEALESRRVLAAAVSLPFSTEVTFDQFKGGEAGVFARGYDRFGNEQPAFLGYEFCRSASCGGAPFTIDLLEARFGAEAVVDIKGRIGLEYGLYANRGTADLIYDGDLRYEVTDPGTGAIEIDTDVRYAAGGLFTQSPTVRGFAEIVLELEGSIRGKACFVACTDDGVQPLNLNERITLIELNRDGNGQVNLLSSPVEGIGGSIFGEISAARNEAKQGTRDQFEAERQIAKARTSEQLAEANRAKEAADQKVASGTTRENDTKNTARSKAAGKKFGGGKIIQMSVGTAADQGLLGAVLDVGVGIGFKSVANIGKSLGSLSLTLPDIALSDTSIDRTGALSAVTEQDDARRDVAKLTLDLGAILGGGFGFGKTEVDLGPLGLDVTTASYLMKTSLRLNQQVTATPTERLRFNFTDPISGSPVVVDASVNGVAQPGVTSIEFSDGDDVQVSPRGSQAVQVTPTLIPQFAFTNDLGLDLDVEGTLRALEIGFSAFGKDWRAGPLIERSNPIGEHDFGGIYDASFSVTGDSIALEPFSIGGPSSDLSVSADVFNLAAPSSSGTLGTGQRGRFSVRAANDGPEAARNVSINLRVPDELTVDMATLPSSCTLQFQNMTCVTDNLPVGESFSVSFEATPNVVRYQVLRFQPRVTSESRELDSLDNVTTLEVPVTRGLRFVVVELNDTIDEVRRSCVENGGVCNLRAAVEAANENPGHDVILLRQATFTMNAPLDITDSLDIIALPGTVIESDQETALFVTPEDRKVTIRLPAANGDLPNWTVAELVNLINRQTATQGKFFPFQAVQMQAELGRGDGSERLVFGPDETIRIPNVTAGGNASTRAAGNVNLPGTNSSFRLIMPDGGQANGEYNGYSLEIVRDDAPRFPLLRFGGPGDNEYRLKGVTVRGGNATMGAGANGHGGAITLLDSGDHLRLDQVVVTDNFAERGGGIAILGGSARITNSVIKNNAASLFGGGLHVRNANVELESVRIEGNRSGEEAGGVDVFALGGRTASVLISDSLIQNNNSTLASAMQSLAEGRGSQAMIRIEQSVIIGNAGSSPMETFNVEGGQATIESQGLNYFDRSDARLNGPGDVAGGEPIRVEALAVPAGVPGADVGAIVSRVPSVEVLQALTVDDARFEIVAGRLKLKAGVALDRTQADSISVRITAIDDRQYAWEQAFTLNVLSLPQMPTNVRATATSPSVVQLRWNRASGDTSFRVLQVEPNGAESIAATVPANADGILIENLPLQSRQTFVIEALNAVGSARSTSVSVVMPIPLPEAPRDLQVESLRTNGARLSWQPAQFATSYQLLLNGQAIAELPAQQNSFTLDTLSPSQSATLRLVAANASGTAASSELAIQSLPLPPGEPRELRVLSPSTGAVTLQWNAANGADEYRVFLASGSDAPQEVAVLSAGTTQFEVSQLDAAKRHELQVFAVNANGVATSLAVAGLLGNAAQVDQVAIDASGQTIDLDSIGANRFPALQTLVIRGDQTASLQVTPQQVRAISTSSDALTIQAGLMHELEFAGDWQLARPEIVDGVFYRTLTSGDTTLRLDQPDQHRNPLRAFDVNGDGFVSPIDALLVINRLNSIGAGRLDPVTSLAAFTGYLDTTGDRMVSPLDALLVINELNAASVVARAAVPAGASVMKPTPAAAHDMVMALLAEETSQKFK